MPFWKLSKPKDSSVQLVRNETLKPSPTEYPILLPTLQTYYGMVSNDGAPAERSVILAPRSKATEDIVKERATYLRSLCVNIDVEKASPNAAQIQMNLEACSEPVKKHEMLKYIRNRKRIDMEQAVAMIISFLLEFHEMYSTSKERIVDEFEESDVTALHELMADPGVSSMIANTSMWREPKHFEIFLNSRDAGVIRKKTKILRILGRTENSSEIPDREFVAMLQKIRRRRVKVNHTQHFTMPPNMIYGDEDEQKQWGPDKSYRRGLQEEIPCPDDTNDNQATIQVIPKRQFRRIHRLLHSLLPPFDTASRYALDVETFIRDSGATSARRMAALDASNDPFALAYSFITAQRTFQLKVVSDHKWLRFLVKGESAMIMQNRPDILTSIEDILVRHAHDLKALTSVRCPPGIRDHFSTHQDIRDRARQTCELMERYVRDFGHGDMKLLIPFRHVRAGHVRGPVDFYNALCDELRDCSARGKAAGLDLQIGRVNKFLAADIMWYNQSWEDDAFGGGKIPGWVEYLARVRAEEIKLE